MCTARNYTSPHGIQKPPDDMGAPARGPATLRSQSRAGTKLNKLLQMIARPSGASMNELVEATGWKKHSIRAAITRAAQAGTIINLISTRNADGGRRYCALAAAAPPQEEEPRNG